MLYDVNDNEFNDSQCLFLLIGKYQVTAVTCFYKINSEIFFLIIWHNHLLGFVSHPVWYTPALEVLGSL